MEKLAAFAGQSTLMAKRIYVVVHRVSEAAAGAASGSRTRAKGASHLSGILDLGQVLDQQRSVRAREHPPLVVSDANDAVRAVRDEIFYKLDVSRLVRVTVGSGVRENNTHTHTHTHTGIDPSLRQVAHTD